MRTDHIDTYNGATEVYIKACEIAVEQIKIELDRAEIALRMAKSIASKEVMARDAARPLGEEPIPAFLGVKSFSSVA